MTIRRIKLQQIVLFGVNLCLRLGMAKPSQYHLDALKKKMGAAKHIVCDCLCAMEKSKDDGAHITGVSLSKSCEGFKDYEIDITNKSK